MKKRKIFIACDSSNLKIVKKIISEKKDLFNRSVKFDKIKNIKKLPNYIIKNKKKFKLYMI